jgi:hypothetical protein
MDLSYINASQICSIEGRFICINDQYEYREYVPKKGLFSKEKKAGFYERYYSSSEFYSNSFFDNRENFFRRDKKIYNYPYIRISMSNGDTHKYFFKTHQEMFEFVSKNLLNNPMINWVRLNKELIRRGVLLEKYQGYSDELRLLLKNSLSTDKERNE